VRFTPLLVPAIMRLAHRTKRTMPTIGPAKARSSGVSRTREMCVEAGVRKESLGNCRARIAKITPTRVCPMSFSCERSPRLRCLLILM